MHRNIKKISGLSGMLVALAFATMPISASAAEEYHDSHCFGNSIETVSTTESRYASGESLSDNEVAAIEELNLRHWRLRLSEEPLRAALSDVLYQPNSNRWWYADSVIQLDQLQQLNERRSGSKIMSVSPAMKQLARARAEIRRLKRKPCSPHMLYLSTN